MKSQCLLAFGVLLCVGRVMGGVAQERVGVDRDSLDFVDHRINNFSPRSGPPGTVVTLTASDMPPLAPFRIGVGALRFGFEESGWVLADNDGSFTIEIEIPSWARDDLVHLFIVFDPYFAPVALSDVFHVTNEAGSIRRQGTITGQLTNCPGLLGPDGVPYTLTGDLAEFAPGDVVAVEGPIVELTECGNTTAIRVNRITVGEPS